MRSLDDLVKKSQFVTGSETLVTLLVVVAKFARVICSCLIPLRAAYAEFQASYASLTDFVVPGSAECVVSLLVHANHTD